MPAKLWKISKYQLFQLMLLPFFASLCGSGCGAGELSPSVPETTAPTIHGTVHGGQQPVSGSKIYLYAASTTGYANASTSRLANPGFVTSDATGSFMLTGQYTCSPNDLMYLIASGGNPGMTAGTNNGALQLMAALGPCSSLLPTTNIVINEVTTVSAAYALAPFMTDATHVGTSSTNISGLATAFANASNLANNSTGTSMVNTVAGNGAVPYQEINTLANILAECVNSSGLSGACSQLLSATSTNGVAATNTLGAILNIANSPDNQAFLLYTYASPSGPFQPSLTTSPQDWTIAIAYTGAGINAPRALAVDASGRIWVGNTTSLSQLSGTGAVLQSSITGGGYATPYSLSVDLAGNIWTADPLTPNIAEISATGLPLSGAAGYAGGLNFDNNLAMDAAGSVFVANYNGNSVSKFNSSGVAQNGGVGFTVGGISSPDGIVVDKSGQVWTSNHFTGSVTRMQNDGSSGSNFTGIGLSLPAGMAVDANNAIWIASQGNSSVAKVSNAGAYIFSGGGPGINSPDSIVIDGNGNAWVRSINVYVSGRVSGDGSKVTSYSIPTPDSQNGGIAIDAAGSVWISQHDSSSVIQIIGAAAPAVTPLAVALANGTIGTRP